MTNPPNRIGGARGPEGTTLDDLRNGLISIGGQLTTQAGTLSGILAASTATQDGIDQLLQVVPGALQDIQNYQLANNQQNALMVTSLDAIAAAQAGMGASLDAVAASLALLATSQTSIASGLTALGTLTTETNALLVEMLECQGCRTPPNNPFPPVGLCQNREYHWRAAAQDNVQGVPGTGNPCVYRYHLNVTAGMMPDMQIHIDTFALVTWFGLTTSATEPMCISMGETARALNGNWSLQRARVIAGSVPDGYGQQTTTIDLAVAQSTGQLEYTLMGVEPPEPGYYYWYCLQFVSQDGSVVPPDEPGVWFGFGISP